MASRVQKHLQAFKKLYPWIFVPLVVGAPMRVFSGPALATAITRAGGIGFMGPGPDPSNLTTALSEAKRILEPFNISRRLIPSISETSKKFLPVGVGIQTFDADIKVAVEAIQKYRPAAVWLFAPRSGSKELDLWSREIRKASPGTQIWIQVGSVQEAIQATETDTPPDVLVLQGIDAGGHGLSKGAGIISLLPEVDDSIRQSAIPLIAAGGIVDGRGLAAVLSLGAVGAAVGTRFLASEEAKISRGYQEDVLRVSDGGQTTVRTTLYDKLAGRTNWPPQYDGRNIDNMSMFDHKNGLDFKENMKRYAKALNLGDGGWGPQGRLTAYVGSAVGLVKVVRPAAEIVANMREEAVAALKNAIHNL